MQRRKLLPMGLLVSALAAQPLWAQDNYPSRAVRIVVPYPAGSSTDLVARAVAEKLARKWGQSVVIENKPGAAGNLGTQFVANAPPDGYTLVTGTVANAISASLYKGQLKHDFAKDFEAVALFSSTPLAMVANPSAPFDNVRQLIAYARKYPGRVNYGSGGNGTSTHLSGVMLGSMAGIELVHVPYKGATAATADLIGGQIQIMFDSLVATLPNVKAGRMKILGVTTKERSAAAPDVPAIGETLPGFEALGWQGLNAPAGTPPAIVEKINRDVVEALKSPDLRQLFAPTGAVLAGGSTADYKRFIDEEIAKWADVVKRAGASAN